jgi:hypothetical protein
VGGIDQARELGLGLVHVDQPRLSRGIHLERPIPVLSLVQD